MGNTLRRGVARIFQRGGGGSHWVKQYRHGVLPRNIVGCLLKKRHTKGGSRAPQDPPSYAPAVVMSFKRIGATIP